MIRRIIKESFVLLNIDHVNLGAKWNYKDVLSPYYRMYYIDGGQGLIYSQKQTWSLEPGFMYLIPGFTLCNLLCTARLSQYFIHFFEDTGDGISLFHNSNTVFKVRASDMDIANFKRLLQINPCRKLNRSDNPRAYEKHAYYQEYEELNNSQSYDLFLETQGILLQLVSKFVPLKNQTRTDSTGIPSKVMDLLGYIQLNLGNPLTVTSLARLVSLHPDYLSRLFVKMTGQRPLAYIHNKRIERAQHLIVTTDMSLSQIAETMGFDNVQHFTKVFRKITSLTPGRYREQHNSFGHM
ncbi:MAG: helix-turn-helix transcriptional regulator [Bacteroidetes bacterium]|nr:helix-turn-helix transcriptional regulator [Bacteroidota bacterium]